MAEQRGEELDHRLGHAGHLDQGAEEDEQRHGEQDEMAHALVETPDHDQHRGRGGEREIAEGGEREGKRDRHAGKDVERDDPDEEHDQVAERLQHRSGQPEQADQQRGQGGGGEHRLPGAEADEAQERDDEHQADADRQRRGAPGIGDLQRRGDDEALLLGVVERMRQDHHQEGDRRRDRDRLEQQPRPRRNPRHQPGHPHVLAALQRQHGPQHRQPQEQDRGQFVRPHQRRMEDIPRRDPRPEDHNLRNDENGRDERDEEADDALEAARHSSEGGRGKIGRRGQAGAVSIH